MLLALADATDSPLGDLDLGSSRELAADRAASVTAAWCPAAWSTGCWRDRVAASWSAIWSGDQGRGTDRVGVRSYLALRAELDGATGGGGRIAWYLWEHCVFPGLGLGIRRGEILPSAGSWHMAVAALATGTWQGGPPPSDESPDGVRTLVASTLVAASLGLELDADGEPRAVGPAGPRGAWGAPSVARPVEVVATAATAARGRAERELRAALVRGWLAEAPVARLQVPRARAALALVSSARESGSR